MSQVNLIRITGAALQTGVVATVNPVETAAWVEVTGLPAIPPGGAHLEIIANSGAIRVVILPSGSVTTPANNGHLIASGAIFRDTLPTGARVFTKLP